MSERPNGGGAPTEIRSLLDRLSFQLDDGTTVSLSDSGFTERYPIAAGLLGRLPDRFEISEFIAQVVVTVLELESRLLALEDERSSH